MEEEKNSEWQVFPSVVDSEKLSAISKVLRNEALLMALGTADWKIAPSLAKSGIDPMTIFTHPQRLGQASDSTRLRIKEMNQKIITYHQPDVRDWILFDQNVISSIKSTAVRPEATFTYERGPGGTIVFPPGTRNTLRYINTVSGDAYSKGIMLVKGENCIQLLLGFRKYANLVWYLLKKVFSPKGSPPYEITKYKRRMNKTINWIKDLYSQPFREGESHPNPSGYPDELAHLIMELPEKIPTN